MEPTGFEQWCIVELFGHQKIAGKVSEQVIAGQGFVRVDVPGFGEQVEFSRLYGSGAIYSIIPTSEDVVKMYLRKNTFQPIHPYELALPSPKKSVLDYSEENEPQIYVDFEEDQP